MNEPGELRYTCAACLVSNVKGCKRCAKELTTIMVAHTIGTAAMEAMAAFKAPLLKKEDDDEDP